MPDPSELPELLRDLAAHAGRHARPLHAAEVRRRGIARHRRRLVATFGSAVLAVAVTAGIALGAVGAGGDRGLAPASPTTTPAGPTTTSPSPSPTSPAGEWIHEIPDDFPIATRLPDYGGDGNQVGPRQGVPFTDLKVCDEQLWPGFGTSDDLSVHYSAPEYAQHRDLVLYADEATARNAFENIVNTTSQCDREESADGNFFSLWDVETEPDQGLRSAWITRTGGQRDLGVMLGVSVYHVVQQGNAVLLLYVTGEADPNAPGAAQEVRSQLAAETDHVVGELCMFAAEGC